MQLGKATLSKCSKITYNVRDDKNNKYAQSSDSLYHFYVSPPSDAYNRKRMVTENELMFINHAIEKTGIKQYNWSLLKNNHDAIKHSQEHLIDLIRYYEGDSNHYYEAISVAYKDCGGSKTIGFGEWIKSSKATTTQNQAYQKLSAHIEEHAKYIRNKVGKNNFDTMPQSIKEALIDLSFNKGPGQIGPALKAAIQKKDWSTVIANIHCVKCNGSQKEEPGLYRRSLSRAILAIRDLTGKERKEANAVIINLYKRAAKCFDDNHYDKSELNKIYEQYTTGKISGNSNSAETAKIKIDNSFKGKGMNAVAQKAYNELSDKRGVDFNTFYEEFKRVNRNAKEIVVGAEMNVPYIQNIVHKNTSNSPSLEQSSTKINTTADKDKAEAEAAKVNKTSTEKTQPKKSWFSKITDGIRNVAKSIKNFFVNLFRKKKKEAPINENNALAETPFQQMVKTGTVTEQGDLNIISTDYQIKKGDTLWQLANNFSTSVAQICNDNNIANKSLIKEGEIIKIKKLGYKVKKGDTLTEISKKFGLMEEILKDLNNIEDANEIQENQMLEIPGFIYTVKTGDTLSKISQAVGVDMQSLKKINHLDSDLIKPGQQLVIVYNDSDFAVSATKKQVSVDKNKKNQVETVDMRDNEKLASRPLLQVKRKVNSKVMATRKVFEPTKKGKLSGKTIIVNAGHGYTQAGTDIGTPGLNGCDDEWLLNYDNAIRLKDKLCAQGAKVIFLQGAKRLIEEELKKRENKADMLISVHVNSSENNNTKDRTQIYYRDKGVSGKARNNSIKLANIAEANFDKWISKNENISQQDKFIYQNKQDYAQTSVNDKRTGLLKNSIKSQNIPSIIWEVAFMSAEKGRNRLKNPKLMNNYADIMTQSIVEYFCA